MRGTDVVAAYGGASCERPTGHFGTSLLQPGSGAEDQTMKIEGTTFGTITIDGKTYEHDVVIRLSGEVVKRKKKLSKKYYGTSHVLSKDEAKFVFEKGCEQIILGSGQEGTAMQGTRYGDLFSVTTTSEIESDTGIVIRLAAQPAKKGSHE
jgi:hypothetical protein